MKVSTLALTAAVAAEEHVPPVAFASIATRAWKDGRDAHVRGARRRGGGAKKEAECRQVAKYCSGSTQRSQFSKLGWDVEHIP